MSYIIHTPRQSASRPSPVSPQENEQIQPKPKLKNRIFMLFLGLALCSFLIWASLLWWEQQQALVQMEMEIANLEEKVRQAEQRQAELLLEKELLHDPEYIAEIARRDYFLSREGETIFKVVE
jgi:cell division protein DivIC